MPMNYKTERKPWGNLRRDIFILWAKRDASSIWRTKHDQANFCVDYCEPFSYRRFCRAGSDSPFVLLLLLVVKRNQSSEWMDGWIRLKTYKKILFWAMACLVVTFEFKIKRVFALFYQSIVWWFLSTSCPTAFSFGTESNHICACDPLKSKTWQEVWFLFLDHCLDLSPICSKYYRLNHSYSNDGNEELKSQIQLN